MITFLYIILVLFFIYVFFYKQSIEDYTILQLKDWNKVKDSLSEKAPIIITDIPIPYCVNKQSLLNTQRFLNISLGSCNLKDYLDGNALCELKVNSDLETYLANETGFHSYVNQNIYNKLNTHFASDYISSFESRICFGSHTLQKTSAIYTIIMPIESKYTVSLVNPYYDKTLPQYYKNIDNIERLQTNVQYIDVIVKPNTILILPAHWYYLLKADSKGAYYTIIDYHEPVSMLNSYLEKMS